MLAAVTFASLCLTVWGATPSPPITGVEPPRCCQDRQWEATLMGVGSIVYPQTGSVVTIDSVTAMSYDFYRKRVALQTHFRLRNGTERVTSSVQDFTTDRQYIFEDGKCTSSRIGDTMQESCVSPSARFVGSSTFGYGGKALNVNTWEELKPGTDILVKDMFTKTSCVPVAEAFYGTVNGATMDLTQVVTGFSPGIKDPSTLDLPNSNSCTFVDQNGPVFGRRSVFS